MKSFEFVFAVGRLVVDRPPNSSIFHKLLFFFSLVGFVLSSAKSDCFRYDRSVVLTGIGQIVSAVANTRYVKIQITQGRFSKQTIYGLSKNVSVEENIALKYPVGTMVNSALCFPQLIIC